MDEQNWPAYNEAQTCEKLMFLDILGELCSFVPPASNGHVGRPKADIRDMVFSCVSKVYEGMSSRRVISDLELLKNKGCIGKTPHFNTITKYFKDPALTHILFNLLRISALPLKDLETTFAVDASGLSSAFYSRWFVQRFVKGVPEELKVHDWLKIHIICGTKTHIVTGVSVTDGHAGDSPQFTHLVGQTNEFFKIEEVYADKAYSSRENLKAIDKLGAIPYIPFKSNAEPKKKGGSNIWRSMYFFFQNRPEEFYEHYHQRSQAESAFSMLKRKFDNKLMMKKEAGRVNEALAKLLCHNICVLIHELYASGISLEDFQKLAQIFDILNTNPGGTRINVY